MERSKGMRLYKATYRIKFSNSVGVKEISQYIMAPNFQTAGKLAETSGKITSGSGGSGCPIVGNLDGMLLKVEQIADDICDFENTGKLAEIGSHAFSTVNNKLLKVELFAVNVIQE
jgi:hypothetical protein